MRTITREPYENHHARTAREPYALEPHENDMRSKRILESALYVLYARIIPSSFHW